MGMILCVVPWFFFFFLLFDLFFSFFFGLAWDKSRGVLWGCFPGANTFFHVLAIGWAGGAGVVILCDFVVFCWIFSSGGGGWL